MNSDLSLHDRINVYLPRLPMLGNKDLALFTKHMMARTDLAAQLDSAEMNVPRIIGADSWLKNMLEHAENSDAFVFTPMSALPEKHPNYLAEMGQRWFEFFSVVTGIHVGNPEKYGRDGISKPCVIMDPDGEWSDKAIKLLHYLGEMGMFSSNVDDIVHVVRAPTDGREGYHEMNKDTVAALKHVLAEHKGKEQRAVHMAYPSNHMFEPMRKNIKRHHFGVAFFGSATTQEKAYIEPCEELAAMIAERGWRMISGAGRDGCMGAADRGFERGKQTFNQRYSNAYFKPAHVGVSTQSILRLEGPPDNLDQLIIADDIYERMKIMIRGQKKFYMDKGETIYDPLSSTRNTTRVVYVAPGGTGTLHEFATMMQLATNGEMMQDRKIVLLDFPSHKNPQKGFWDPLIEIAKELGFDKHFEVARSPQQAIEIADKEYEKWLERNPEHKQDPHPVLYPFNPRGMMRLPESTGRQLM